MGGNRRNQKILNFIFKPNHAISSHVLKCLRVEKVLEFMEGFLFTAMLNIGKGYLDLNLRKLSTKEAEYQWNEGIKHFVLS